MSSARRHLDLRHAAAVLAEDGADRVTMAQIAARLGIAKPTLYRLAGSKAGLQRACVEAESERMLEHLHAAIAPGLPAPDLLPRGLRALERYARESPGGFRLLFERRAPDSDAALRRLEHRLAELLRLQARQTGRELSRPELLAAALLGAAAAVVSRAMHDDGGGAGVGDGVAGELAAALGGH